MRRKKVEALIEERVSQIEGRVINQLYGALSTELEEGSTTFNAMITHLEERLGNHIQAMARQEVGRTIATGKWDYVKFGTEP